MSLRCHLRCLLSCFTLLVSELPAPAPAPAQGEAPIHCGPGFAPTWRPPSVGVRNSPPRGNPLLGIRLRGPLRRAPGSAWERLGMPGSAWDNQKAGCHSRQTNQRNAVLDNRKRHDESPLLPGAPRRHSLCGTPFIAAQGARRVVLKVPLKVPVIVIHIVGIGVASASASASPGRGSHSLRPRARGAIARLRAVARLRAPARDCASARLRAIPARARAVARLRAIARLRACAPRAQRVGEFCSDVSCLTLLASIYVSWQHPYMSRSGIYICLVAFAASIVGGIGVASASASASPGRGAHSLWPRARGALSLGAAAPRNGGQRLRSGERITDQTGMRVESRRAKRCFNNRTRINVKSLLFIRFLGRPHRHACRIVACQTHFS